MNIETALTKHPNKSKSTSRHALTNWLIPRENPAGKGSFQRVFNIVGASVIVCWYPNYKASSSYGWFRRLVFAEILGPRPVLVPRDYGKSREMSPVISSR